MKETNNAVQEKRDKQHRIRRMKNFIVAFVIIVLLISIAMDVFLIIEFAVMNKRMKALEISRKNRSNSISASRNPGKLNFSSSGTGEDNLADPDDTLKVYLTFDDGPSRNTSKVLDTLDDYGVKATFFVNGRTDKTSIAAYKRIVAEGHTIGMHSYTHDYKDVYASLSNFEADYNKIHDLIEKTTGVDCKLYRFPGGSSNHVSGENMANFIKFLNDKGIRYFDWNVSSQDATNDPYTPETLIENVMTDVVKYKTSVVLMHDAANKDATVQALPKLIEELQEKGAVLLPISDDTIPIQHVTLN